jgi:hypothetical protein
MIVTITVTYKSIFFLFNIQGDLNLRPGLGANRRLQSATGRLAGQDLTINLVFNNDKTKLWSLFRLMTAERDRIIRG